MTITGVSFSLFRRLFSGIHYPLGISIDITNRCNLRCKHCYFLNQNQNEELSDNDLIEFVKDLKMRYPSVIHAGWIGGEPLLRKELLSKCVGLFKMNMIVTNGTIEIPKFKNSVFNVSVDGTKEFYEMIRGAKLYDKVKANADRDDIPVNVMCVLNKINCECIESFVEEWSLTRIQGISFSFYTPQKNCGDDPLLIPDNHKDILIDRLITLKEQYGDFIINSKSVLKLMKFRHSSKITRKCIAPKALFSFDAMGNKKLPCVLGSKVDCSKCGCVMPYEIESVVRRLHFDSIRMVKKYYTGC